MNKKTLKIFLLITILLVQQLITCGAYPVITQLQLNEVNLIFIYYEMTNIHSFFYLISIRIEFKEIIKVGSLKIKFCL